MPFQTHWFPPQLIYPVSHSQASPCMVQPEHCQHREGSWFMADWQRSCPKQKVSTQAFKADSFIPITWQHQLCALAAQEGWVDEEEEDQEKSHAAPLISWWQFKTTAKSRGDRCAGQERHPKLLSFLSLRKAGCNLEPERESRQGSPCSFLNWFTCWWPEGVQARPMGDRNDSRRTCSSSPATASAEGQPVTQHSRAAYSIWGLVLHRFTLTWAGQRENFRANSGGAETNWCCHQPLGDPEAAIILGIQDSQRKGKKTAQYPCWRPPPCRHWEEPARRACFCHPQPCSSEAWRQQANHCHQLSPVPLLDCSRTWCPKALAPGQPLCRRSQKHKRERRD